MANTESVRVLVKHSDPLSRAGLAAALAKCTDFAVQTATDERLEHPDLLRTIDVVVADYQGGIAIAELVGASSKSRQRPRILVVAVTDREWEIRHALGNGVHGYLLAACSLDDLAIGVRAVHRGARYLSPGAAATLAESMSAEPLTTREEEVLRLVIAGLCNKAISRRLGIAVGTVKSHLRSTYEKLDVQSRTQAIAAVDRRGLLSRGEFVSKARSESHFAASP